MIKNIKHIIFDLGGVILNLDYTRTQKGFEEAGISNFSEVFSQLNQPELFDQWEMGKISRAEFIQGIQKISPTQLQETQVINAWNAMMLDFPLRRLQILQQLRLYYDLFLLSNTNEIHEQGFNDILSRDHGMPNIAVFFDKIYLSHRVGMRKPDKAIYQLVLDDNGLKPEHTLFIDDNPHNIEAAKALGIQTIYLEKGMTIEDHVFLPKKTMNDGA